MFDSDSISTLPLGLDIAFTSDVGSFVEGLKLEVNVEDERMAWIFLWTNSVTEARISRPSS